MTREQFEALRGKPEISVLIIGGGVNGIGTFRDLAVQGVDVLLVERGDFCSGASAASSHMLHGGIRYLENGEFRLVREALTERNLMLRNAPHYSKPLPTTIPMFQWFSGFLNAPLKFLGLRDKPSERGAAVIKIGLIFYDIFARSYKVMPNHKLDMKAESLRKYPKMNPDIVCTATYYDAWMPYPERICAELVLDTETIAPGNAVALNYVSAVDGSGDTVTLRDELSGETVQVKPKVVVNAAGPWIDFVNRAMKRDTRMIGGTKGSHLILDHPELLAQIGDHEIFFENKDGRIVLILPFLGKVMVGTTDIRIDNPDEAVCTESEIEYMLGMTQRVFPTIKVDRSHIIFNFSGVRPLPNSDKSYTGNVSRDHSIKVTPPGADLKYPILSLVGGKWTTFRAFAEQTADRVLETLGKPRKTSTKDMAIGGGKNYPKDETAWLNRVAASGGLPAERVKTLFERYGTRAEAIVTFIREGADSPLQYKPDYSHREILFLVQNEKVKRLDDLILRRTLMAWLGGMSEDLLIELANIVCESLKWSEEDKQGEVERTMKILREKHGLDLRVKV